MKNRIAAAALFLSMTIAAPAHADDFVVADSGLYLSGHVLGTMYHAVNHSVFGLDEWGFRGGYGAIAAVGYAWTFPEYPVDLRMEIEGSYRTSQADFYDCACGTYYVLDGDLALGAGMANLIVDIHTQSRIVPHFGIGVGRGEFMFKDMVFVDTTTGTSTLKESWEYNITVWQGIAGMGLRLSPGLVLDVEYRMVQPNDPGFSGFLSNEFTAGFRMIF